MLHARPDYQRIQDPAVNDPSLLSPRATPIAEDEPVFILRAQDLTAVATVRFWATLNKDRDPEMARMAIEQSDRMAKWHSRKFPDYTPPPAEKDGTTA